MTAGGRLLTLRSGGWVLLAAGCFALGVLIWALAGAVVRHDRPLIGDGSNVETYGFDLEPCLVRRDLIVAGGMRKDALRALVEPLVVPGGEVEAINARSYGKYLVRGDRVIGVRLGGEARAYPLPVMEVHEVANDTLGGIPIAVTYNPLCDSVAVFERRVAGEVLEFGVSGLLYNSNLLLFDRREGASGESLWSQLLGRAIAGPAAADGKHLRPVATELTTWSDWLSDHPQTTVLSPDPRMVRRYRETTYETYFRSRGLMFPVDPEPPADGPAAKDPVIVVGAGGRRAVYPLSAIGELAGAGGIWESTLGPARLRFRYRAAPQTVVLLDTGGETDVHTMYAFWFAWHAIHPEDRPAFPPPAAGS